MVVRLNQEPLWGVRELREREHLVTFEEEVVRMRGVENDRGMDGCPGMMEHEARCWHLGMGA
jgi:hypothetical protein